LSGTSEHRKEDKKRMEQGKLQKSKQTPTLQQLRYLLELEKVGNERGVVTKIAEACNVNHTSVSRYLKYCQQSGILNEEFEFTQSGKIWLANYKWILEGLDSYMRDIGISETEIQDNIKNMVEHVGMHTLSSIVGNHQRINGIPKSEKREYVTNNFWKEVLPIGTECPVYFMLYRRGNGKERGTSLDLSVSMANSGFEKPALLRHNRRGSWLILKIREMSAKSRIHGKEMQGHLSSLKYEKDGMLLHTKIKDGILKIPLEACRFHRRQGGEVKGILPVTMTCTVGRAHMPESTAVLIFWL